MNKTNVLITKEMKKKKKKKKREKQKKEAHHDWIRLKFLLLPSPS